MATKIETLHTTPWLSLKRISDPRPDVDGYIYAHEERCRGIIVAILPTRVVNTWGVDVTEFLLREEKTPCWSTEHRILSAITGGWEGGEFRDNAVRELREETGYQVAADDLVSLGVSYASKSSDTVYHLYTVDLTGREPGMVIGDGTAREALADNRWVRGNVITECMDPQVSVMFSRNYNRMVGTVFVATVTDGTTGREL